MDNNTQQTDILQTIVAHKREELEQWMQFLPPRRLMAMVDEQMKHEDQPPVSMRQALLQSNTGIIAEFKRKSPSKAGSSAKDAPASFRWPISKLEPPH